MIRLGHDNADFFIGSEVEHTPAFSKKTLFVIGNQSIDDIIALAKEHNVAHVFLTANQSFDIGIDYNITATALLSAGYMVTIDYPVQFHDELLSSLNSSIWQNRKFIPLVSCKISDIDKCGNNLTVKIDDTFNGSNGGVWCWDKQALLDNNRFTDWNNYAGDEVIDAYNDVSFIESVTDTVIQTATDIKDSVTNAFVDIVQKVADGYVAGKVEDNEVDVNNSVSEDVVTDDAMTDDTIEINSDDKVDENVANTTSVSVDSADVSTEPELVAKKSVKGKKKDETN